MTARFDIDALKAFVGDEAFPRGEAYCRDGLVTIIDTNAARVCAQVSGTAAYRTIVTGKGANIGGDCSCRRFPITGRAGTSWRQRLRPMSGARLAAAPVDIFVDLADRDPATFQRLDLADGASRARP